MSDELEAILRSVASGEMSPDAAMKAIDEQKAREASATSAPSAPAPEQPTPASPAFGSPGSGSSRSSGTPTFRAGGTPPVNGTITAVRVLGSYRSVQVTADPSVAQLYVTGTHRVSQEGTTLIVSGTGPLDEPTGPRPANGGNLFGNFSFSDLPRTLTWAKSWKEHQLEIRVNPELLLELETTGAEVKLNGLVGGLKARVVASSLKADRLRGRLDVEAVSSSVKISAVPLGESRLTAESSSARLTLLNGSDLRISGTNRMGRLQLPDRPASTMPLDDQVTESVVGSGRDLLQVEAVMSSVTVGAQVWDEAPL
ncbi:hypothetical protein Kisp01_13680 [Kineosporia sp. NBRC 101677]|uniref:hypothetical protein n=1 Tax=Kineosporia sp. NBRC 101677 TaxID=3032197 RepID=UPI0024A31E34|nr:hypothetical protein [Kineosporia sp. NBRC 101677]GLY14352.1 hypothetical protein Kisp01_13680 [Kineosporia sp. NBRC 101677]